MPTLRLRRLPTIQISKLPRTIPKQQLVSCFSTQAPKMSVYFPRFQELSPIFRIADELDRAARHAQRAQLRSFSPKFDVKETKETYELSGELPGIEQSNVNIEWSDENTISIYGKTESRYSSSSDDKPAEAEAESQLEVTEDSASETYQKPSVEDEGHEVTQAPENSAESTVAKTEAQTVTKEASPKSRYWVTERSIGSFHRTFTFPGRVEHDQVKASLKNGILSIVIPKAKALEPKKITIN